MRNNITIYDIASALSLSPSTVSRALSGGNLVKELTQRKILEKARELGYRPNLFASNLRIQRTSTIGVIVPRLTNILAASVVSGAEVMAHNAGLTLIVRQTIDNCNVLQTNIEDLGRGRVDGLLISAINSFTTSSIMLNSAPVPAVVFESVASIAKANGNGENGAFRCAYSAAKHLIEGGSTRIVFVKTRSAKQHEEAFSGYAHALKEYQQASLGRPIQINVDENGHRGFYLNSAVDGFPDGIVFLNGLVSAFRLHGVGHRNGSEAVVQAISLSNEAGADVYNLTCHIPQLVGLGEFANSLLIEFINYNHNA